MIDYDVTFIPVMQGIVFKYNNDFYEVNEQNLMKLKKELQIPYKLYFVGCSRAEVGKIITGLNYENDSVIFLIKNLKNKKTGPIRYIVECHKNKSMENESEFTLNNDSYSKEEKYLRRRNGSRKF